MKKILIVEDNEKNMKLARDLLQAKGYATLEATTGVDGVRLAKEHTPDLVLMDIQLPDINGIEASSNCAPIRARPRSRSSRSPPRSRRPTARASCRPDSMASSASRSTSRSSWPR